MIFFLPYCCLSSFIMLWVLRLFSSMGKESSLLGSKISNITCHLFHCKYQNILKTHIIQWMMFLALMHSNKKKSSVYIQPLPVASDLVHQNTKGIMPWFMCLMHWHYFMSVIAVEEKLLMVTGRASTWDLNIC